MPPEESPLLAQATQPPAAQRSLLLPGVGVLALGLLVGVFLGRFSLESSWSTPFVRITPDQAKASSSAGANPSPSAGSRVLKPMPLARSRLELATFTKEDPVQVELGSLGRDDNGMSVTLRLLNRGRCTVTSVKGVAYGFDAWNQPARLNLGGEHYIAFQIDDLSLAPGAHAQPDFSIKHPDTASLVVAHINEVLCSDGAPWRRAP